MHSITFFSASRCKPFSFLLPLVACVALSMMLPAQAQTFRVLYSFNGPPDAQAPHSNLLLDGSGNIYGITFGGGSSYEGTAFKLNSSGKETVLYSFLSGYGNRPDLVIQDAEGTLYGTTTYGGSYGQGAVFKLDQKENETVLYSFRRVIYMAPPDSEARLEGATATAVGLCSSWIQRARKPCCTPSKAVRTAAILPDPSCVMRPEICTARLRMEATSAAIRLTAVERFSSWIPPAKKPYSTGSLGRVATENTLGRG